MFSTLPLATEIIVCFLISISLLHRYSDFLNHNVVVIGAVAISWFLSMLVIFILPADLTSTAYRQCLFDAQNSTNSISTTPSPPLNTTLEPVANHSSISIPHIFHNTTPLVPINTLKCDQPWNYVGDTVMRKLWRFIYWFSQFLTWIILPLMQSYSMAGDFTPTDKLKTSLRANLIYYTSFGAIFFLVLMYLIIKNGFDFQNLKVIVVTSANTWGLFLLVVLLGYGLIELPRSLIKQSLYPQSLSELYFRVAKTNAEKCEAESKLDEVLEEIHQAYVIMGSNTGHHLRPFLDKVTNKCPPDWKKRSIAFRRQITASNSSNEQREDNLNLQTIIDLHSKIKTAVHYHRQIICKWNSVIEDVIEWEDVAKNQSDGRTLQSARSFVRTLPKVRTQSFIDEMTHLFLTPTMDWYWKCFVKIWIYRLSGIMLATFSLAVVWSEVTFLFKYPVLSLFAIFINGFQQAQDYFLLEIFSILSIGYLASCAFYTVFHMKIFNIYYLAPKHQTDEYSLIFSGMLLCRLAAPLCLNYLCLVQRDSHLSKQSSGIETSFTSIMGHLDLIPVVNSGLNIILPLCISAICIAMYFNFGTYLLHQLGFDQYIEGDELTGEYVHNGRELVKREKAKLVRALESSSNYSEMSQFRRAGGCDGDLTRSGRVFKPSTEGRDISIDLTNVSPHSSGSSSSGLSQSALLQQKPSRGGGQETSTNQPPSINYAGSSATSRAVQDNTLNVDVQAPSRSQPPSSESKRGFFDDI